MGGGARLGFIHGDFFTVLCKLVSTVNVGIFLSRTRSCSVNIPKVTRLLRTVFTGFNVDIDVDFLVVVVGVPLFLFTLGTFNFGCVIFSLVTITSGVFFLRVVPRIAIIAGSLAGALINTTVVNTNVNFYFGGNFSANKASIVIACFRGGCGVGVKFVGGLLGNIVLVLATVFFGLKQDICDLLKVLIAD